MEETKSKGLLLFERFMLITVALICGFLIFLRFINQNTFFGQPIDYAWITSILLVSIVIHFLISSFKSQGNSMNVINKIEISKSLIIESIRGVEKRTFNTITEVDSYVAKRILEAKYSVKDLNWQDYRISNPSNSQQNRNITDNEIDASIKKFCCRRRSKDVKRKSMYEEIFTFPPSNKTNLQKMKSHTKYGDIYSCSYYETLEELKFPKLQFVIIDDTEVIFVSSEYSGSFCAIRDKNIVSICANYFMQARDLSKVIKEKNQVADFELIKTIESKYK